MKYGGKYAGRDDGSAALSATGVQSPSRLVFAPGFEAPSMAKPISTFRLGHI